MFVFPHAKIFVLVNTVLNSRKHYLTLLLASFLLHSYYFKEVMFMKNITLVVSNLEDYYYEQKLNKDPATMSYHYDFGRIDFPKTRWEETYQKRIKDHKYFAYIKDCNLNKYIGTVNYQYNNKTVIGSMKNLRRLYQTMTLEAILSTEVGICI